MNTPYENPGDDIKETLDIIELKIQSANKELVDVVDEIIFFEDEFRIVQDQFTNNEEIIDNLEEELDTATGANIHLIEAQIRDCKSLRVELNNEKQQLNDTLDPLRSEARYLEHMLDDLIERDDHIRDLYGLGFKRKSKSRKWKKGRKGRKGRKSKKVKKEKKVKGKR